MQLLIRPDPTTVPPFRRLGFTAAALCGLALMMTIFVVLIFEVRNDARQSAKLTSANLSATLAYDVERNFEVLDESLKGAARSWADPRVQNLPDDLRKDVLFDSSITATGFGNLVLLDRTGSVLASLRPIAGAVKLSSSRDFFVVHVDNPSVGLFVSRPFLSDDVSKEWVIALSRRINDPDGSFAGVAVVTLKLESLDHLLAKVDLGTNGIAALLRLDGTIVAQYPQLHGDARRNRHVDPDRFDLLRIKQAGSVDGASSFDGEERITSFRRVDGLPLIQVVELGANEVYAGWRRKTIGFSAVILLLSSGSLFLFFRLNNELTRRIQAEAELNRIARTDPLTALANRRAFDSLLEQYQRQAVREGSHLSLLMIDADYFKLYNDSLGHLAGDEALKLIARCIQAHVHRPGGLPCRIGGEEFAVLLPETDEAGAVSVAEAIRSAVKALSQHHLASPLGMVTVSVGVASLRATDGPLSTQLVDRADNALYRAKEDGRDRVRSAEIETFRAAA